MAGFSVPYGLQSWRAFVAAGHLPRLLQRICVLVEGEAALGFELAGRGLELELTLELGGEWRSLRPGRGAADESADEAIAAIIEAANQLLAAAGVAGRLALEIGEAPRPGNNFGYRVVFGDAALPVPEDVVPAGRILAIDPSYASFLAGHLVALAELAGLGPVRCQPSPSLADLFTGDDFFGLQVTWGEGATLVETVRIPRRPLDLQPIFDCINARLAERGEARLYRCMDRPWGEMAVLATPAETEALRRTADLIEPRDRREVIERLGAAGFQLPYMGGWWSGFSRHELDRQLVKTRALAADLAALEWNIEREGDALRLRLRADGETIAADYPAERAEDDALAVFAAVLGQANRALAEAGVAHRFLALAGAPLWSGHRVVLLPVAWANQVAAFPEAVAGSVVPDAAVAPAWPIRHPSRPLEIALPRLPEVRDLVPPQRRLESDFKCSARPSDLVGVVESIAELAGLEVSCDGDIGRGDGGWILSLRSGERRLEVVVDDRKYVDATPVCAALNELLAEAGDRRRLHVYAGGYFEGGVLLAAAAEASELRRCGYID